MDALLPGPIPEESEATCNQCAMQPREGEAREGGAIYYGEQKCCTYWPQLHNFLVGALIADGTAEMANGRATLERVLAARTGVTPLVVTGTGVYWLLYSSIPS